VSTPTSYNIRTHCIICSTLLTQEYLEQDNEIPLACYATDTPLDAIKIPYNIYTCDVCFAQQTKYLGDLNVIYKHNHADSTGELMQQLHYQVFYMLEKYSEDIKSIVEVGASKGILSDIVLKKLNTLDTYYVIDPNFTGSSHPKRIVISDFIENVDKKVYEKANTLIMSHVLEHFYDPISILATIQSVENLEYFCLVWPDLQSYKNNNNNHFLNIEHTFYIDNNMVVKILNNFSFDLVGTKFYKDHSVIFMFKRNNHLKKVKLLNIDYEIDTCIQKVILDGKKIKKFISINNKKIITIFPCSVHTQYLLMYNPDIVENIDYMLDNSPQKIGRYLYGYNIECVAFEDYINKPHVCVILNGGNFNKEVVSKFNSLENVLVL
jgi:hypothetical protein